MTEENTIPGQCIVLFCELSGGFMKEYIVAVQIPAFLCGPKSNPDAGGNLVNTLVEAYNCEVIHDQVGRCITCGKAAKEILRTTISLLS
jgi:hypothetical protein